MLKTSKHGVIGRLATLTMGLVAALLLIPTTIAAQDATPTDASLGSLDVVATQSVKLKGDNLIWQVDQITAYPESASPEEFRVGAGFIFANLIPITVNVDRNDPVELAVGEALAVQDASKVTAFATDGTLGSFYSIEIIDLLEIDNDVNRRVIGVPFENAGGDYVLDLKLGVGNPGVAVTLDPVELPALVLILDGAAVHVRDNRQSTELVPGDAGSGTGNGNVLAEADGVTFLLAEVTKAE